MKGIEDDFGLSGPDHLAQIIRLLSRIRFTDLNFLSRLFPCRTYP